jgi:hypothetical protein
MGEAPHRLSLPEKERKQRERERERADPLSLTQFPASSFCFRPSFK